MTKLPWHLMQKLKMEFIRCGLPVKGGGIY